MEAPVLVSIWRQIQPYVLQFQMLVLQLTANWHLVCSCLVSLREEHGCMDSELCSAYRQNKSLTVNWKPQTEIFYRWTRVNIVLKTNQQYEANKAKWINPWSDSSQCYFWAYLLIVILFCLWQSRWWVINHKLRNTCSKFLFLMTP